MTLRIATFNLENLFGRYAFLDRSPEDQPKNYVSRIRITDVVALDDNSSDGIRPKPISEEQRKNTAAAALAVEADIMAVCEVENNTALRLFNAKYMRNYFDRCILVDGNDPRAIDVGLLVRKGLDANVVAIRSNADLAKDGKSIIPTTNLLDMRGRLGAAAFSRDCLEVDVDVGKTKLTFLVNHFKAQEFRGLNPDTTTEKRRMQAGVAASIVARVKKVQKRHPILLGDLNKDIQLPIYDGSLDPLLDGALYNTSEGIADAADRWTHFWERDKAVSQLDYVLVDKTLKSRVESVGVFRGGLSVKCKQYTGPRVGTIGNAENRRKNVHASDHCALHVDLDL